MTGWSYSELTIGPTDEIDIAPDRANQTPGPALPISAIVRPDWLAPEARQHAAGLRGRDYQEVQRRYAEEFFLPTDDADLKERLIAGLASLPQHVTLFAWEQHLMVWDGEEAAAACRVAALLISSGRRCATSPASRS
jgi:hypothetical protein